MLLFLSIAPSCTTTILGKCNTIPDALNRSSTTVNNKQYKDKRQAPSVKFKLKNTLKIQ